MSKEFVLTELRFLMRENNPPTRPGYKNECDGKQIVPLGSFCPGQYAGGPRLGTEGVAPDHQSLACRTVEARHIHDLVDARKNSSLQETNLLMGRDLAETRDEAFGLPPPFD